MSSKKESHKHKKSTGSHHHSKMSSKESSPTITRVDQKEVNGDTFFEKIVEGLLNKRQEKGVDQLLGIVADATCFTNIISFLSNSINLSSNNLTRQMSLFSLFIDLLTNRSDLGTADSDDVILNYLRTINTFTQPLETLEDYERVHKVVATLIDGLTSTDDSEFFNHMQNSEGPFFSFLIATHSAKHNNNMTAEFRTILNKIIVADPATILAASYFFESHQLDDFNEERMVIFTGFGGEGKTIDLIKELLGGSTLQKRIAIRLLQSLCMFLNPDAAIKQLVATLSPVIEVLKTSDEVVRLDVACMISALPANCDESIMTNEAQIKSILAPVCEYLTSYEGAYAEAILTFTTPRQSYPKFNEMINAMFVSYKTSFAALMLCNSLNLYSTEMFKAAFPRSPVSDQRVKFTVAGFKFLLENGKIEKPVFKGAVDQLFFFFNTESFLQDKDLKEKGLEAIDVIIPHFTMYHKQFCKIFLKTINQIKDFDFYVHFAKAMETVETVPDSPFQPRASEYAPFYCGLFTKLYQYKEGPLIMFQVLRVFNPQIREFPRVISELIPIQCTDEVKKQAFLLLKTNQPITVACASMPKLGEKEIQLLVKAVQKISPFDPIIFDHFYTALSHLYLKDTMKALSELSMGKKLNTGALTSKKKKEKGKLLVTTTLAMIPKIIDRNQIDASQQKQIYEIILSCFPKKAEKIMKIKDEAVKLNDSFKKLSEAKPPKDLSKKLIVLPLFADSIPIIVKSLKPDVDLALTIIKTWSAKLEEEPEARLRTQPILDVIFETSKDPKVPLSIFSTCASKFATPLKQSFAEFAMLTAAHTRANNYNLGSNVQFVLELAHIILSDEPDVRYAAYQTLIDIEGLDPIDNLKDEIGVLISPSQLKESALNIFMSLALKEPVTELISYITKITSMKTIELPHALLLRSILAKRNDYMTDGKAIEAISSIIENAKNIGNVGLLELEAGLLDLSLVAMPLMVPLLMKLSPKIQYRKQFLTCILLSASHRKIFLEEFHKLVVNSKGNAKSLQLFTVLPMIIDTEPSVNMSPETFGTIVAELLIWMSFAYSNAKEVGKSGMKNAAEEISSSFETMFIKTDLAKKVKISVGMNDLQSISQSIATVVTYISKLQISKLKVLHKRCKTMLKSKNQSVLLIVGILDIHLSMNYIQYQNHESKKFNATLARQIANTFEASNNTTRRFLATIMPKENLDVYKEDDQNKIFIAMTDCMSDPMKDYHLESIDFYSSLMKIVSNETIESQAGEVLRALRCIFPKAPLNPSTMLILERYICVHADVTDFITEALPNFETFFFFAVNPSENNELRKKAQDLFDSLGGNSIADLISEKFQPKLLKDLLIKVMKNATDLDEYWFNLVSDLNQKVFDSNKNDDDFKSTVFCFTLNEASRSDSPHNAKALEVMRKLMM